MTRTVDTSFEMFKGVVFIGKTRTGLTEDGAGEVVPGGIIKQCQGHTDLNLQSFNHLMIPSLPYRTSGSGRDARCLTVCRSK